MANQSLWESRQKPDGSRGIFAVGDIPIGTLIIAETPTLEITASEWNQGPSDVIGSLSNQQCQLLVDLGTGPTVGDLSCRPTLQLLVPPGQPRA